MKVSKNDLWINKMENYEYEVVQACKKFMRDFNDISLRHVYNPFTDRKVKKGSSTYISLYTQVKKYLENIDDEEFHSPLKIQELLVDIVPARETNLIDVYLSKNILETDTIDTEWHKYLEKSFKKVADQKNEIKFTNSDLMNWKFDSPIHNIKSEDLDTIKIKWLQNNPEIYSFLDCYKPEVFNNKYLMKHLTLYNYNPVQFMMWLQTTCDSFLKKSHNRYAPDTEMRYPVAMIMLWIYQPFIVSARKFLKKNKKVSEAFLQKKPPRQVGILKQHLESIILAFFIRATKVEDLNKVKNEYEKYFQTCLSQAFDFINKENIVSKYAYKQTLFEYLSNHIRPYRYTYIRISDIEEFDKIVEWIDNPEKLNEKNTQMTSEQKDTSKDEVSDEE